MRLCSDVGATSETNDKIRAEANRTCLYSRGLDTGYQGSGPVLTCVPIPNLG